MSSNREIDRYVQEQRDIAFQQGYEAGFSDAMIEALARAAKFEKKDTTDL